jgi:hypothetical protein
MVRAMQVPSALACAMAAALGGAALAPSARAETAGAPAAARARYGSAQGLASGTVFFLATPAGPVAVGAAHSFEVARLAASPEIAFELGRTHRRVATATRVLVGPGVPLAAEGGSLRSDLVVFALDAPPAGVRVLAAGAAKKGMAVQVLGIPGSVPRDQDEIPGAVRAASGEKLEVELDHAYDVRGFGGAPVVARDGGSVVGIVQAAQPDGRRLRVLATPISAVLEALDSPLEGGRGRVFASLAEPRGPAPSPKPSGEPEMDLGAHPKGAARFPRSEPQAGGEPEMDREADSKRGARFPRSEPKASGEIHQTRRPVSIEIEYPPEGAVLGGDAATFVAGRALAPRSEGFTTDVVFAIDVSSSAGEPSGVDVNGNGIVGAPPSSAGEGLYGRGSVDPGDSVLAAEIAAVRRFLTRLDRRYTRAALVTFAGEVLESGVIAEDPARTECALTDDYEDLQRALDRVLARGPRGATHMAAGVDRATAELLGTRSAFSRRDARSQKVVVFLTDGVPTLPFADPSGNVRAVLQAAARARRANVRVFPYGVGETALAGPLALVDLASITEGVFTPVRDPARLSDLFAEVDLADVESVTVRNATTGAAASASEIGADGSFGAWVPLAAGRNELEVRARAPAGLESTRRVTVHFAPDAPSPPFPPPLLASRNRVLELHLAALRRARLASEQEQVDALRKQLRVEIERERAAAEERAEAQRKDLRIEVEPD